MRKCKNNNPELIGQKFGRLTVVGFSLKKTSSAHAWHWDCKCDCGNMVYGVRPRAVRNGETQSCGCLKEESTKEHFIGKRKTHGMTETRLYGIWSKMKRRCGNSADPAFVNYGARGITVCDKWHNNFQAFYNWAMENGYNDTLSIERKDVNKGYSPDNCCWIPLEKQAENKRNVRTVVVDGEKMPLKTACEKMGLPYKAVHLRITRQGMSIEDALAKPFVAKEETLAQKCRERGLPYGTIQFRIKHGWSEDRAFNTPIRSNR